MVLHWYKNELKERAKGGFKLILILRDIFVLNSIDIKTLETEIDQAGVIANLQVPRGEWVLSPDPWLTHNIIVTLIRDQILHSPDNALVLASDWLTHGHVTQMLASDWSADECHMSQVTYLECVTLSGRTAHNLAFFVSHVSCQEDINNSIQVTENLNCCLTHWKQFCRTISFNISALICCII